LGSNLKVLRAVVRSSLYDPKVESYYFVLWQPTSEPASTKANVNDSRKFETEKAPEIDPESAHSFKVTVSSPLSLVIP
jgi:hypothetical protein